MCSVHCVDCADGRLVELDKLRLATRKEETKELASKGGVDPYIVLMPPSASKGGVSEKLVKVKQKQGGEMVLSCRPVLQVCEECREEFCSGSCIIFQYDSYQAGGQVELVIEVHNVIIAEIDQRQQRGRG